MTAAPKASPQKLSPPEPIGSMHVDGFHFDLGSLARDHCSIANPWPTSCYSILPKHGLPRATTEAAVSWLKSVLAMAPRSDFPRSS